MNLTVCEGVSDAPYLVLVLLVRMDGHAAEAVTETPEQCRSVQKESVMHNRYIAGTLVILGLLALASSAFAL